MEMAIDNNSPTVATSAFDGRVRQINNGTLATSGSWTTVNTPCVVNGAVSNTALTNVAYIFSGF
jgi:hypothetical protein